VWYASRQGFSKDFISADAIEQEARMEYVERTLAWLGAKGREKAGVSRDWRRVMVALRFEGKMGG
jgi:hypothetical protein